MRPKGGASGDSIVVAGALANKPRNGGAAWTRLSWLLGFKALGFPVFFLEQIRSDLCTDHRGRPVSFASSDNLRFFRETMRDFGLDGCAALICDDGAEWEGAPKEEAEWVCETSQLLVNISGHLRIENLFDRFRKRIYLDLDPGFTQIWNAQGKPLGLNRHHLHFTVGENIGSEGCLIPATGPTWRATRQPVLLELWPQSPADGSWPWTTVASWRGPYGPVEHAGRRFGVKAHEFRRFLQLPKLAQGSFELALDIDASDSPDRVALLEAGWSLVDPLQVAADPASFQTFVQKSRGEFSAAQSIYVETASGWFSDRTTRYLATGRPAVVQDTGFSRQYPVGKGLLAFQTLDQAVDAVAEIGRDYESHCRAARRLAEEYFDSDRVLSRFLEISLD